MSYISSTEAFNNKYPSEFNGLSIEQEQEARKEFQVITAIENEVNTDFSNNC